MTTRDLLRDHCLTLPHTTEQVQWGEHIVMKIFGKIYAVMSTNADDAALSIKADPELFGDLIERPGVRPAPHLQRAKWIRIEPPHDLRRVEIEALITTSHTLVYAGLPKKVRDVAEGKAQATPKKSAAAKKPAKRAAKKPSARK
ncbi:MAG: MmcQ/YjbR family DNA-binding protein [Polyangiales bacterium]